MGDVVEVINGQGQLAKVSVEKISKDAATCHILELTVAKKPPYTITLALALIKQTSLELAIEKATEIGVDEFFLFSADRSQKKECSEHAVDRLQTIMTSATKQCGRLFLPTLSIKKSLHDCMNKSHYHLFGALESSMPYREIIPHIAQHKEVTLWIGPESGFSDEELTFFTTHSVQGISLSPFTLRAETAAIAGSLLLYHAFALHS